MTEATEEQHYTAWITTDKSCLTSEYVSLIVLKDEISHHKRDDNGFETDEPVWASKGDPVFSAELPVKADEEEWDKLYESAKSVLADAGWEIVSEWDVVDTGGTATVERV